MWFQEIWWILLSTKNINFESVLLVKKNENRKTIIEIESTLLVTKRMNQLKPNMYCNDSNYTYLYKI